MSTGAERPPLPSGSPEWLQAGIGHVWLPYTQMAVEDPPLAVVGTEGVRIRLADGRELLDGMASWWTACHGYNHPRITKAIQDQAASLAHVMFGGLVHEPALRLALRLAHLAPGDLAHVFFSDSGSVAVEVALKMALQYWFNRGETGRRRFLCFSGGYHGDTIGAMSVSDADEGSTASSRGRSCPSSAPTSPATSRRSRPTGQSSTPRGGPSPGLSSSRWCRGRAACCSMTPRRSASSSARPKRAASR